MEKVYLIEWEQGDVYHLSSRIMKSLHSDVGSFIQEVKHLTEKDEVDNIRVYICEPKEIEIDKVLNPFK